MAYLIEITGSAKGCSVVPTVGREFTTRNGKETVVSMGAVNTRGYDGFIKIDSASDVVITGIASGMKNSVQVELPYPWSKHSIVSNVDVETFCRNGYFDSMMHWLKCWAFGVNKAI